MECTTLSGSVRIAVTWSGYGRVFAWAGARAAPSTDP